jgi:hypothetical protein
MQPYKAIAPEKSFEASEMSALSMVQAWVAPKLVKRYILQFFYV